MFSAIAFAELVSRHPWLTRLGFFLNGALLMLSFAPLGWYPLALLLVLPVLFAFYRGTPRQAAHCGFAFGAGLFLAGTYWLYVSVHVFGEAPLIVAVLLMIALVIIMAFYYAATGWLIARLGNGSGMRFLLLAPTVWVILEWLRGWFMSGFPWMTIGYSQIDSPLAGVAPVLGVLGVSLLLMLSACALLLALLASGRQRGLMLVIAAAPWLAGATLQNVDWTHTAGAAVRTTIVQGGVSQDRKWLREQFRPTLDLYRETIIEHADSDLLIWPEVAIPAVLDQVESYVSVLQTDVAARDMTLLFGILERNADKEFVYNSVVALDGSRRQVYRKRHLVPFGEYFPVPDFVREWMRMMNLPYSDITSGAGVQPLLTMPDGNQLAVAICYEDAYAAEQLYALTDARILINVSNDAWFGDSIAPHQHLQIARMRALEAGRYVVRATNNGISAFIGPDGELVKTGPQFRFVTLSHDVIPRTGLTPYARGGNWPIILLSLLPLLVYAWRARVA